MSGELEEIAGRRPSIVTSRADRQHGRDVVAVVNEAKRTGLEIDAAAAVAGRAMERIVDLDNYRRSLSNGDPVLDSLLARVEVNFVDLAERRQRNQGSMFK